MKMNSNFEEVYLSGLKPGSEGVVTEVEDDGPVGRRLHDLGLLPHTLIKVVRRAPLGDPVEFELRGYRLCLRSSDADRVRVRIPW
jgi:Fe2+ transport system protein FeoA